MAAASPRGVMVPPEPSAPDLYLIQLSWRIASFRPWLASDDGEGIEGFIDIPSYKKRKLEE